MSRSAGTAGSFGYGNTEEALERMSVWSAELSLIQAPSAAAKRVADS
jgi:hypothetical protein